jgi:IS605 OrfB family transposase
MDKWYKTEMDGDGETAVVVIEAKCHDPSVWKLHALESASVAVSSATASILARIKESLAITMDAENDSFIGTADLFSTISEKRAVQFRALLNQPLKSYVVKKTGEVKTCWFTNAYRIISCEQVSPGRFRAVARLVLGEWKEGKRGRKHAVDLIPVTTGLQRLVFYAAEDLLEGVPSPLRNGVCQQVAQDIASYLGQLESAKVKGEVAFPSIEDRNPERRKRSYERAIDVLVEDLEPIARIRARDASPNAFAQDDTKGDRMLIRDDRWDAVMRSPEPHPIPLFFVTGNMIRLVKGSASFDAGISKRDRHAGRGFVSERVYADRPEKIRRHGNSGLEQWYAAIPIPHLDHQEERMGSSGRHLPLDLHLALIQGGDAYRPKAEDILFPLSADKDRFFRVLQRTDMEIAWARLTRKGADWYMQLTLRMNPPVAPSGNRVLGVSFSLDAIATWIVLEMTDTGYQRIAEGALAPNGQILAFLAEKREMEWDQAKGRWIGGHSFAKKLEGISHRVANELISLAKQYEAVLCLEQISYVQKRGSNHEANLLFSAWNFGQLPTIAEYKSRLAGSEVLFASDYVTNFTCPICGAIANAKDSPEKAATRRQPGGTLECRKCQTAFIVRPVQKALIAAMHGLKIRAERKKREQKKEKEKIG